MNWTNALAKATNWLDTTLGTGGVLNRTAMTGVSYFNKYTAPGTFIGDIGKELVGGFIDKDGKDAYNVPLPQASQVSGRSAVATGKFSAKQAQSMGWNNPKVQQAYAKAVQSNNPSIRAALDVVRPTIGKKGPTKSLHEAKIG